MLERVALHQNAVNHCCNRNLYETRVQIEGTVHSPMDASGVILQSPIESGARAIFGKKTSWIGYRIDLFRNYEKVPLITAPVGIMHGTYCTRTLVDRSAGGRGWEGGRKGVRVLWEHLCRTICILLTRTLDILLHIRTRAHAHAHAHATRTCTPLKVRTTKLFQCQMEKRCTHCRNNPCRRSGCKVMGITTCHTG